ncbi:MAG: ABC transporter substrate-binding protein [Deltaproteobacteria bacterium]|nr:ABC transporter substrate-binding protein [Deltaproteobacteria bacterium]
MVKGIKKKSVISKLIILMWIGFLVISVNQAFGEPKVTSANAVGGIFDITGPTNSIGAPFAEGAKKFFAYVNKHGGINGLEVNLISIDYQYDPQKSMSAFSRLTSKENILGLLGWGSVDMPLVKPKAAEINLPVISAAARGQAVIGEFNPVVFSIADTYAEEWIKELFWINRDSLKRGIGIPKVAIFYSEPGREGAKPVLKKCKELGFQVPVYEFFSEKSMSASSHIARAKKHQCDYVMALCTLSPLTVLLKDAYRANYKPQFFGDFFCASQLLFTLAGKTPGKVIVTSPVALMDQTDVPGIKTIIDFTKSADHLNQFVAGWVGGMVLTRGIEKANIKQGMTISNARKSIVNALNSFKNESFSGLTLPMSFSNTDHIGTKDFRMYVANWDKNAFERID